MFIQTHNTRPDGFKDCFQTIEVESKDSPLWHHNQGLQFTSTGYGSRIPTRTMVKFNGKWRRVYCKIYSNIGTCYIGKLSDNLIVN